jgi:hypothetical protein
VTGAGEVLAIRLPVDDTVKMGADGGDRMKILALSHQIQFEFREKRHPFGKFIGSSDLEFRGWLIKNLRNERSESSGRLGEKRGQNGQFSQ